MTGSDYTGDNTPVNINYADTNVSPPPVLENHMNSMLRGTRSHHIQVGPVKCPVEAINVVDPMDDNTLTAAIERNNAYVKVAAPTSQYLVQLVDDKLNVNKYNETEFLRHNGNDYVRKDDIVNIIRETVAAAMDAHANNSALINRTNLNNTRPNFSGAPTSQEQDTIHQYHNRPGGVDHQTGRPGAVEYSEYTHNNYNNPRPPIPNDLQYGDPPVLGVPEHYNQSMANPKITQRRWNRDLNEGYATPNTDGNNIASNTGHYSLESSNDSKAKDIWKKDAAALAEHLQKRAAVKKQQDNEGLMLPRRPVFHSISEMSQYYMHLDAEDQSDMVSLLLACRRLEKTLEQQDAILEILESDLSEVGKQLNLGVSPHHHGDLLTAHSELEDASVVDEIFERSQLPLPDPTLPLYLRGRIALAEQARQAAIDREAEIVMQNVADPNQAHEEVDNEASSTTISEKVVTGKAILPKESVGINAKSEVSTERKVMFAANNNDNLESVSEPAPKKLPQKKMVEPAVKDVEGVVKSNEVKKAVVKKSSEAKNVLSSVSFSETEVSEKVEPAPKKQMSPLEAMFAKKAAPPATDNAAPKKLPPKKELGAKKIGAKKMSKKG